MRARQRGPREGLGLRYPAAMLERYADPRTEDIIVFELLRTERGGQPEVVGRATFRDSRSTVEAPEDVKIAVDELCFALLEAAPTVGTLDITAERLPGELRIEGTCAFSSTPSPSTDEANSELTAQILSTVVDEYDVTFNGSTGRFRLRKSRS